MDVDEATLRRIICSELDARLGPGFEIKFDQLRKTVEDIIGCLDTDEIERTALGLRLSCHDDWIKQLAKEYKVKLSSA